MEQDYKIELMRIVKHKLSNEIEDSDIEIGIEEVEQYVLNYCNIYKVPFALRYVLANMVIDLLNYQYYTKNPETGTGSGEGGFLGVGDISNIQIGDTQIKLGSWSASDGRSTALKSHIPNLDEVLFNYNAQLNQFRRLY